MKELIKKIKLMTKEEHLEVFKAIGMMNEDGTLTPHGENVQKALEKTT